MHLFKSIDKITKLLQIEDFSSFQKLECWVKSQDNYNIHIFSIQLSDEAELLEVKEDLRDYLAIYFQSQILEKDVERWNIYQVFFVQKHVRKEIKQQIEQDKFATRKLVIDNLGRVLSDVEIDQRINDEIFKFEFSSNKQTSLSLVDSLETEETMLFNEIINVKGDINLLLNPINNE